MNPEKEFLSIMLRILDNREPVHPITGELAFRAKRCLICWKWLTYLCFPKTQRGINVEVAECWYCHPGLLDYDQKGFEYETRNLPANRKFDFIKLADFILTRTGKRYFLDDTELVPLDSTPNTQTKSDTVNRVHGASTSTSTSIQVGPTVVSAPVAKQTVSAKIHPLHSAAQPNRAPHED
ncbi:MAG: hypothetical protein L6R42_006284 [Xanthoria sp. 1 TBL-2021]|nr:MAG: hypothetical protein L6R42_006284 [Xanthoria sp. 1 TBL-2021]